MYKGGEEGKCQPLGMIRGRDLHGEGFISSPALDFS